MKNIITPDSENLKIYKEDKKINYLTNQSNSQAKDQAYRFSETSKIISSKIDDDSVAFDQTPKNLFQSSNSQRSQDKLNVPSSSLKKNKTVIIEREIGK